MSCAEPAVMFRCSLFAANISAFTLGSALGIWLGDWRSTAGSVSLRSTGLAG